MDRERSISMEILYDEEILTDSFAESFVNESAIPISHTGTSTFVDKWPDDVIFDNLPDEILKNIFTFLTPRERRSAKLVCRKWFRVTNCLKFSCHEKKVFYDHYNMQDILELLSETADSFLNLEFRFFKFADFSSLKPVMHKIYFLDFVECEFSDDCTYELINNCPNLQKLRWKGSESCFNRNVLDRLEQNHFTNENLKIFKIISRSEDMSNENIHSLFTTIFPNIRKLSFQMCTQSHYNRPIANSSIFSFCTVLDEVIERKNVLEQLKLNLYKPEWLHIAPYSFTRLKDISVFIPDDVPEEIIFDFFSRQPCLERISCTTTIMFSCTSLLKHLINHCPELKHLKLTSRVSSSITFCPRMFFQLANSKLSTLELINSRINVDVKIPMSNYICRNENLRVLRILGAFDCRIQLLFTRYCVNLTHLELTCASGIVLRAIGESLRNLKILKLSFPVHSRNNEFSLLWNVTLIETCLRLLSGLEHLSLSFQEKVQTFDFSSIPRSVKYFRFYAYSDSSLPDFSLHSLKDLTNLEDLRFRLMPSNDINLWIDICSSFSKLRRLQFDDTLNNDIPYYFRMEWLLSLRENVAARGRMRTRPVYSAPLEQRRTAVVSEEEPYEKLINACPSLRLLIHKIGREKEVRYVYDFCQKKMRKADDSDYTISRRPPFQEII